MAKCFSSEHATIVLLDYALWQRNLEEIMRLEESCYEPKRRHTTEFLDNIVSHKKNTSLAVLCHNQTLGYCFAGPLELFPHKRGTRTDPNWGLNNTLYSADLAVAREHRGRGLARLMKTTQVKLARELGYERIAGRNRVGLADDMWHINQSLGAYQVQYLHNEYDDNFGSRDCIYYHLALYQSTSVNQ